MKDVKKKYSEVIREIIKIADKSGIDNTVEGKNLIEELNGFVIKIPLIGSFNAGKSSLLNRYLGVNYLPVDIIPETAIASELKFGYEEHIIAHNSKGTKVFALEDIKTINSVDYDYLEVFINSELIKPLQDIVLVDMPGIDSKFEHHNKAILNYIKEGVEFLVLNDIENGGLKESVLDFINEVTDYDMKFSIILSKSDLKSLEDKEKIYNETKRTINGMYSDEKYIGIISSKNNDIEDFVNYLKNVDAKSIAEKRFSPKIKSYLNSTKEKIDFIFRNSDLDESEIKVKIDSLNEKMTKLEKKIEQEKESLSRTLSTTTKQAIIDDVERVLINNIDQLVQSAKAGQEIFSKKIGNLVRPTLVTSMNTHISKELSSFVNNINIDLNDNADISSFEDNNENPVTEFLGLAKNIMEHPAIRALLIGGAVFTTVLAPIIEVIIIFLPELLKLLGIFNNDKKYREQIENNVIPNVIDKIAVNIEDAIENIKNKFIEELSDKFTKEKEEYLSLLDEMIEEKKKNAEAHNMRVKEFEGYLSELKAIEI